MTENIVLEDVLTLFPMSFLTRLTPEPGSPVEDITWSDLRGVLENSAQHYLYLREHCGPPAEFFSCPDGEKIKIDGKSVLHAPLYRDEDSQKMLLLVNPKKRDSVLAVYMNGKWWGVDEVLQSCMPVQQGLKQVQTCGERIVLFVLNCLVCGFVEGGDSENGVCFLPHSAGELAKIFWHHKEAVAFYTYKNKGNLCDKSNQCYMLPVLDTIYVREKWRRHGFGIAMLQDFCHTFVQEVALGVSSPISPEMYHVFGRFLADNHKEQDRLWEVEPPGDWSQRTNIWLQIQLGETPVIKCPTEGISKHQGMKIPVIEGQGDSDRENTVSAEDDTTTGCSTQQLSKRRKNQVEKVCDTKKRKLKSAYTDIPVGLLEQVRCDRIGYITKL
ncbi:protein FAM169B-like isoform X2 [Hyla sarda]|uniref:protein FAM169B-like isoform X2 n=1 Tax=Hyla sarda TaxID=327740 RepID=UPI0024C20C90|nr:protein FAM169B-like isoform X2 [Hyla sarda]